MIAPIDAPVVAREFLAHLGRWRPPNNYRLPSTANAGWATRSMSVTTMLRDGQVSQDTKVTAPQACRITFSLTLPSTRYFIVDRPRRPLTTSTLWLSA